MEVFYIDFKSFSNLWSLLRHQCIKDEVYEYLKGFELRDLKEGRGSLECHFEKGLEKIDLVMNSSYAVFKKSSKNVIDETTIGVSKDGDISLSGRRIEKRERGILIVDLFKKFDFFGKFNNWLILTDLSEDRYIISKESLEGKLGDVSFSDVKLSSLLFKLKGFNSLEELEKASSYTTRFSTHMGYYMFDRFRGENPYSSMTYLNGEDISSLYDSIDGAFKLDRIYNLYRGVIDPKTEEDIYSINLGFLKEECFDVLELKGIRRIERRIIGEGLDSQDEYMDYLCRLFRKRCGYKGKLTLDRSSIMKAIKYENIFSEDELSEVDSMVLVKKKIV